jgi:hypothetical protein
MTLTHKNLFKGSVACVAMFSAVGVQAVTLGTIDNTTVKIGGYVKLDAMYSDYDAAYTGLGRDFYVPSTTPVPGGGANDSHSYFDMHARQTRLNLSTDTKTGEHTFKSYIEVDFMVTADGDERISNSYAPRLRHAFIKFDNWLFGQTWSTFQNVASLPETVDFIGNTDAGIFVRQPQIRYTAGDLELAIENPETTVSTAGGRVVTEDSSLPDFVARYNIKSGDMSLAAAALVRQLKMDQAGVDSTEMGYGISVTGKVMLGKDDIRFGVNTGSGMGRYIGLNVANGAIVNANNELEAIDSTGLFASFRHHWNDSWRSNFTYSQIDIDNNVNLSGGGATKGTYSARANLLVDAAKNMTLGGEIALANRELESGNDGDMTRLQFMAMYKF